ncbi:MULTISPECIES: magnesium and cobalt transport protein CorA [Roseateles]|uniref:Magnesium and cobalt transport protein CorA n=1 Tax=Pelomonas caseinilytica TaxID=2906763 RepID=A0ABS8XDX3_9BURK|nr:MULTISPECIES: magnesium and cobalt transport protein CorA [unclassified Roseateles]MCE4536661.1 magnesium and cobalt transport protein CorA [Pelomonas sp. P7]HEV6967208.1 magnesium and cobalt transport protein CorA [Roseateles sp.]
MLINSAVYDDGRIVAEPGLDGVSEALARQSGFVWIALRDPTDDELGRLQHELDLPPLAVEDARKGHQRPKVEEYGDMLFAAMHLLDAGPDGELQVGEVHVFVGARFVVSVRHRSDRGFLGVRDRSEREPHLLRLGPGFVFYALMDAVVDRYFPLIDAVEAELEHLEATMFQAGQDRQAVVQRLFALKQRLATLRHAVTPLLEVTAKLHGGRVPAVCKAMQDYFRDVYDHLVRIQASIDAARETIIAATQVNLTLVTIDESLVTKRLAAWAAIFAASTALAGIWGMNFEKMPELKWAFGYPMALGAIGLVSGALYWRFKRLGWL